MNDIREAVRSKYGEAARQARSGGKSCCDPVTANLYDAEELAQLPELAASASLGCGNPTYLAELHPGEIVLDLGSGGGIDVLLSARRVGPMGKAYGLDMTDEMLELARENQRQAGVTNVEFLKGEIEKVPLPDNAVALEESEYRRLLAAAGFLSIDIEPTRDHGEGFVSAFVRARKPQSR